MKCGFYLKAATIVKDTVFNAIFCFLSAKIQYLTMTDAKKVWMPDTFFRNEKEGRFHNILVPNVYIRIFPNGNVLYSIRVSLTLACPMNLKLYPLDRQKCSLRVASCKYQIAEYERPLS